MRSENVEIAEMDSGKVLIAITHRGEKRFIDRKSLVRLLDAEETQTSAARFPVPQDGGTSLASIGKLTQSATKLGPKNLQAGDLDKLIDAILQFNGVLRKRITSQAGPRLREMLEWDIPEEYKDVIQEFLKRYPQVQKPIKQSGK